MHFLLIAHKGKVSRQKHKGIVKVINTIKHMEGGKLWLKDSRSCSAATRTQALVGYESLEL
jgi:hypothetical protein